MKKAFLLIMILIFSSGCATSPQILPWEDKFVSPRTGEFDKRTGVYKNNEIGFTFWFPAGYEIWTDESVLRQWAKDSKYGGPIRKWIDLLFGANERESIFVEIMAEKNSMSLSDYVYFLRTGASSVPMTEQEKEVGGTKYIEGIYSGPQKDVTTGKEVDLTLYYNILDMKDYKVHIWFYTITQSLNQRRKDEMNEIMNSFKKF